MEQYQNYNNRSPRYRRQIMVQNGVVPCDDMSARSCQDSTIPCGNGCNSFDDHPFPIGMGYVPTQKWREVYSPEDGFLRGTIFAELNLPFMAGRCVKR